MVIHKLKLHGSVIELHDNPPSLSISKSAGNHYYVNGIKRLFEEAAKRLDFPLPENYHLKFETKRKVYPDEGHPKTGNPYPKNYEVYFIDINPACVETYLSGN